MTPSKSLTLAEELMLIALDDERGTMMHLPPFTLELAIAASLIMELTLIGRVDTDAERLTLLSGAPTGNAILDEALAMIAADTVPHPTSDWLNRLSAPDTDWRDRLILGLVERGVLKSVEKKLLWVFKTRVYPPTSGIEESEVNSRIMTLLNNDDIPDAKDALLIGLLRATNIMAQLLSDSEHHRLNARITQIANLEEISRSLTQTIMDVQILLATANFGMR